MKNVLVTGGAGFIGSNFIHYLLKEKLNACVYNLDVLTYAGNLENLKNLPDPNRYRFIHGDICDKGLVDKIFTDNNIDTVVHFAAETHVDRSIQNPLKFMQTNIIGTTTLLDTAVKCWRNAGNPGNDGYRFHHISTDEVYGSLAPGEPAFSEQTPYAPNSPYAASKAASDHLVRAYYQTYQLPVSITNCSNNYGPFQFPEKLIPLFIQNAIHGKPLPVYGDGKQIRDWLYVEDHCNAILTVIEAGQAGETYNIGGNNQPFNIKIIKTICEILDDLLPQSPYAPHFQLVKYVTDRPGHDRRYAMDITKIKNDLGWQPRESLNTGLYKTVQWFLENPDWVKTVVSRIDYQDWIKKNYGKRGENNK